MAESRPRVILAILYGFLAPGVGHLYAGRPGRALFFFLAPVFGALLIYNRLFVHASPLPGLLLIAFFGLLQLWSLVDAGLVARKAALREARWYHRWYGAVGLILLFSFVADEAMFRVRGNFEAFRTPSRSMSPEIEPGDCLIVDKRHYRDFRPLRGDVGVAVSGQPAGESGEPVLTVMRIVGIEGDTVAVRGAQLFLNGSAAEEPYVIRGFTDNDPAFASGEAGQPLKDFPPQRVPKGAVFLLGDNRTVSNDGRHWAKPFTPIGGLIGKVTVIYFNATHYDRIGLVPSHAPETLAGIEDLSEPKGVGSER